MNGTEKEIPISKKNISIKKYDNKCIKCGYCTKICCNEITVAKMYDIKKTKKPICINCGQCTIFCPTEAIKEQMDYKKIKKILKEKNRTIIFNIAPAVRVALGEEFGIKGGMNVDKKIVSALKKIGANYVFDITFGADLTTMEEAMELVKRIKENKKLPMFTSCCPAWVKYAEIFYPQLLPNLSTCKSPIAMQGTIIKTYFAKKINKDPKDIVNIVVAPCTAKKYEIKRKEINFTKYKDTDYVITTRELGKLLKEEKIKLNELKEEEFDSPLGTGSGAGIIFGNTGGVAEAAIRTAYYYITGKDLKEEELIVKNVRGIAGIKQAQINIQGKIIKIAVVNGMRNAKNLLNKILNKEIEYDFVEVMNCNGGCIAGGGQPKTTLLNREDTKLSRINGLYKEDEKKVKRFSYKNPDIIKIYEELLKEPNSNIAYNYLHTTYENKSYLLNGERNENE